MDSKRLFSTSFQASRRTSTPRTLLDADASLLGALDVSADSVTRLPGALDRIRAGFSPAVGAHLTERVTTSASAYTRFDFFREGLEIASTEPNGGSFHFVTDGAKRVFYLIGGGSWNESHGPPFASSTSSPFTSTDSRSMVATVQAFHSIVLHGYVLNETRSTFNATASRDAPVLALPSAAIAMQSAAADGSVAFGFVQVGGAGGAATSARNWSWHNINETRWSTADSRHEMKVALDATLDRYDMTRGATAGAFSFNSLSDFLASQPSVFARTLTPTRTGITGIHGGLGIGDLYRPSKVFGVRYGVRVEGHRFGTNADSDPTIDSLFDVRSGRIPSALALSPMAGFTWKVGRRDAHGYTDGYQTLTGGIRDYRAVLRTSSLEPYARDVGSRDGSQRLVLRRLGGSHAELGVVQWITCGGTCHSLCQRDQRLTIRAVEPSRIGRRTGLHAWAFSAHGSRMEHSPRRTRVRVIARTVVLQLAPGRDVRPELQRCAEVRATGRGRAIRFRVSEQHRSCHGHRCRTRESRRFASFARVTALRSDLRSRANSLTATVDYQPFVSRFSSGIKMPLRISYTIADVRSEATGFSATTSGDPRDRSWGPGAFSRHAVLLSTGLRVPDWLTITAGLQLRSGVTYTPRVDADVNGDVLANDRAFVFDPESTTDPVRSAGFTHLQYCTERGARLPTVPDGPCGGVEQLRRTSNGHVERFSPRGRGTTRPAESRRCTATAYERARWSRSVAAWRLGRSRLGPVGIHRSGSAERSGFDPVEKRFR